MEINRQLMLNTFKTGLGKQSRSIFMEMDANASKPPVNGSQPQTPTPRTPEVRKNIQVSPEWPPSQKRKVQIETTLTKTNKHTNTTNNLLLISSESFAKQLKIVAKLYLNVIFPSYFQLFVDDVVKSDEKTEAIKIETADITNKFKFFETYKPAAGEKKQFRITPPRDGVVKEQSPDRSDIYIDPDIVRAGESVEDPTILQNSHTTTKMLSMFRQMEEVRNETPQHDGSYTAH